MTCRFCRRAPEPSSLFCAPCAERWAFVAGIQARLALPSRAASGDRRGISEVPRLYVDLDGARLPVLELGLVADAEAGALVVLHFAGGGRCFADELPRCEVVWEQAP